MPNKPLPSYVTSLIDTYQKAQEHLIKIIETQEARGTAAAYRKSILESVNKELDILNKFVDKWANDNIHAAYESGVLSAYKAFRAVNIETGKVQINTDVVEELIKDVISQLTEVNAFIGRRIADDVRQASLEAIADKMATGSTVKQTKKRLIEKLTEKGYPAILDKNKREIKLDVYSSMVARTTTRQATNLGSINAVTDLGYDLVKISEHHTTCEICAAYEGRVYSISGNDPDYPALDKAFKGGYSTLHPNCAHVCVPYFPEFDDNAEKVKEYSKTAGKMDPKKQIEVDRYNKDQKIKAERRKDRNEWEAAKIAAPDETPKTFSGYRAMKRAGNDRYKSIKAKL